MVARGTARKLTSEELLNHRGPIHYICHHAVVTGVSNQLKYEIKVFIEFENVFIL